METNLNNDQEQIALKEIATKKVIKLKSFYKHLFVYLIAMILFLLKEYTNLPVNVFPIRFLNWVVVIIWTAVIIGSVIDLVASFMIFDEEWEERKMRDILEKKYRKQKWE